MHGGNFGDGAVAARQQVADQAFPLNPVVNQ